MNTFDRFIDINGIRVHYIEAGTSGSTVVLLHGGGLDAASISWGLLIPELAHDHRVIAPDFPGYGESEKPAVDYDIPFYVLFVSSFLAALDIHHTNLMGISMGGGTALGFTLEEPARVEKLVLVDSYGLQRSAPFQKLSYLFVRTPWVLDGSWALMRSRAMIRYALNSLLKKPGAVTEELVEGVLHEIMRPGASTAFKSFQRNEVASGGTKTCYLDRLTEIGAPTLIIHGTRDSLVPLECAHEAHQRIQNSQLYWMDGCGHWPQRDDPEQFNRVVREFLRS